MRAPTITIAMLLASPALAADPLAAVQAGFRERLPANWQAEVGWQGRSLVAAISAPAGDAAFDLLYDPEAGAKRVADLCPPPTDVVWQELAPDQDIVIEPRTGQQGELRVSCRASLKGDPG